MARQLKSERYKGIDIQFEKDFDDENNVNIVAATYQVKGENFATPGFNKSLAFEAAKREIDFELVIDRGAN